MATDANLLQGDVNENPNEQKLDVERLLAGFLKALLREASAQDAAAKETRE